MKKNDFITSLRLIDELVIQANSGSINSNKAIQRLKEEIAQGYDVTESNYHLFNAVIQKEGIPQEISYPFLKELVSDPSFVLREDQEHESRLSVMFYLAASSYWLRDNLFNEKAVLKAQADSSSMPAERNLIGLLDIGCILLKKGFEFPKDESSIPEIGPYINTYIQFTKKRYERFFKVSSPKKSKFLEKLKKIYQRS